MAIVIVIILLFNVKVLYVKMPPSLSLQEKIEIVLIYGENYKSCRETAEIFNGRHPDKNLNHSTVAKILKKFKETGTVDNKYKVSHEKPVTGDEATLDVLLTVTETPQIAVTDISQATNIEERSVRRILKSNKFYPYKPKFVQVLKERDYDARFYFCAWFQGILEDDGNFPQKILFTDEATFTSNGTVSSQNCRWWATENPNFVIESKDQYSFKTNVWCGILNTQIVGPFFFRENLNARRYLNFLETEVSEFLDNLSLRERRDLYFQQDGASIHCTADVRFWLDENFGNKWIGRFSENSWPSRSPDLTPLDFFLWGFLKNKVYKHRPFRNIDHLEGVIRNCAVQISPEILGNVSREMRSRTVKCMERNGGHVEF